MRTLLSTFQLSVLTSKSNCDAIERILFEMEALSVSFTDAQDQPIFEPEIGTTPLWDSVTILALFSASPSLDLVINNIQSQNINIKKSAVFVDPLPETDWVRAWMDDFKPMQYGENFWVVPHHLDPPDKNAINLRLDPGLAFGTGTHPTTRLCLQWIAENDLSNKTVVDFGCGSGILAIAACLCGAKKVICTDIDPQALEATANNAKDNKVEKKIKLYLPEDMPKIKADVVLANILSGPLCKLSETINGLCKDTAQLVLSGILAEQQETVAQCYEKQFDKLKITQDDDWVRIVATR